jgi:hypothetical protein
MSKLLVQVEKDYVGFIFDTPLSTVVMKLNKLINKYGDDATLGPGGNIVGGEDYNYNCVYVKELESDQAHEHRLKYNSTMEFAEREELRRLQEKYPLQKYPLDIPS